MTSSINLEDNYWQAVIDARPNQLMDQQASQSEEFRSSHSELIDLKYGDDERQKFDLFLPEGDGPWPLLVFFHGGYWQFSHKNDWAFMAPGWLEKGVAFATIGYRLAPAVTLDEIAQDALDAVNYLSNKASRLSIDNRSIILSGISAGAHLASMVITSDELQASIPAAILCSGVYDPMPLLGTTPGQGITQSFKKDLSEISPISRHRPCIESCMIAWGELETPAFKWQSKMLANYWACRGAGVREHICLGANHYSIVDSLMGTKDLQTTEFILKNLRLL